MATMIHRSTFALDTATTRRLKTLASRWSVSQAEVIRRAIAHAEKKMSAPSLEPVEQLQALYAAGQGLCKKKADAYLQQIATERKSWRKK